jgi:hypothetical protein
VFIFAWVSNLPHTRHLDAAVWVSRGRPFARLEAWTITVEKMLDKSPAVARGMEFGGFRESNHKLVAVLITDH